VQGSEYGGDGPYAKRESPTKNLDVDLEFNRMQERVDKFRTEAELANRQAQSRIRYGLITVLSGLVALSVLYIVTLYFFTAHVTDPEQVANNVVATMGVVTGVIGSLVSAYFGIQLGSAGRERAESQRDSAIAGASDQTPSRQQTPGNAV
jgi:hypothetical protein